METTTHNHIHEDLCTHGFSLGFCPRSCLKLTYKSETANQQIAKLRKMFTKREMKNKYTKESVILKLHQIHLDDQFIIVPDNFVKNINNPPWRKNITQSPLTGWIPILRSLSIKLRDQISLAGQQRDLDFFEKRTKVER